MNNELDPHAYELFQASLDPEEAQHYRKGPGFYVPRVLMRTGLEGPTKDTDELSEDETRTRMFDTVAQCYGHDTWRGLCTESLEARESWTRDLHGLLLVAFRTVWAQVEQARKEPAPDQQAQP